MDIISNTIRNIIYKIYKEIKDDECFNKYIESYENKIMKKINIYLYIFFIIYLLILLFLFIIIYFLYKNN